MITTAQRIDESGRAAEPKRRLVLPSLRLFHSPAEEPPSSRTTPRYAL